MPRIKDKKFKVSGVDGNGDIHSFETDDRELAKAWEERMQEDLNDVAMERQRFTV